MSPGWTMWRQYGHMPMWTTGLTKMCGSIKTGAVSQLFFLVLVNFLVAKPSRILFSGVQFLLVADCLSISLSLF